MNAEQLEAIAAELRVIWPTIRIDLAWLAMLGKSTKDLTVEQVGAGIKDLFDEGRNFPPNLSEIVHAARWRARNDQKWEERTALPEGNRGLHAYLESIGVNSMREAVAHEGRKRLGWDEDKATRWLETRDIVGGVQ